MSVYSESEIRNIVEQVIDKILKDHKYREEITEKITPPDTTSQYKSYSSSQLKGVFETIDDAVKAAQESFRAINAMSLEQRRSIIEAIRKVGINNARLFSDMTRKETKMGRLEDKIAKHYASSLKTPGIEDLYPRAWSGDDGLTIVEMAPWGSLAQLLPQLIPSRHLSITQSL